MEDLYKELRRIFDNNPQTLENRSGLQGVLKDCIKQDLYVNLLMNAYDINICDEFNKANDLDELFINRLNRQICRKYGTNDEYAKWSIVTWALACNKQIPEEAKIYLKISGSEEEGKSSVIEEGKSTVVDSASSEQSQSAFGKMFQIGKQFAEDVKKSVDESTIIQKLEEKYKPVANEGDDNSAATPTFSTDEEMGSLYYDKGDYRQAMRCYKKAVDAGSCCGMFWIGVMYRYGKGVERDYEESFRWFLKVAETESSDAGAAYALIGILYRHGNGVQMDEQEALQWFRKGADAGDASAMYYIGCMHQYGEGVAVDLNEALAWYRKAAEAGDKDARNKIRELTKQEPPKSDSSCYITTAVCESLHKPDDCYELMSFRQFRDGWLTRQPGGERLIGEYYAIAPAIVQSIDAHDDAKAIYLSIWSEYLAPCLGMIEKGRFQECQETYQQMVYRLKRKFIPQFRLSTSCLGTPKTIGSDIKM